MEDLVMVDVQGHVHSVCLHWEGLPCLLWEMLSAAGYPYPPLYEGHDFMEGGVRHCNVTLIVPPAPAQCGVGIDRDSGGWTPSA